MKTLLLVLLLITTVARAEMYSWTDKEGTIHFSDSPGNVPTEYLNSAATAGRNTGKAGNMIKAVSSGSGQAGTVAPRVEELKNRMLKDEGIMALIAAMQNDPEMQAVLGDPSIVGAVQSMDVDTLTNNPAFMKLLNNPGVREIVKKMQQDGMK
jgi:hypothetical protein